MLNLLFYFIVYKFVCLPNLNSTNYTNSTADLQLYTQYTYYSEYECMLLIARKIKNRSCSQNFRFFPDLKKTRLFMHICNGGC